MDQKPSLEINNERNLNMFTIVSVIAFFCLLLNVRVFHFVYSKSTLKSRPANILVAHLSGVVIGFICGLFLHFLEKLNMLSMSSPGVCGLLAFSIHTIYNMFSLNIGAILWVRTRKDAVNLGRRRAFRIIGWMWFIAIFGNLPSFFMAKSVKHPDKNIDQCKQMDLFGYVAARIAYDCFRLVVVNTMRLRTERTTRQIKQVRFVQRHSIILMITWFPHGVGAFLYRMFQQLGWIQDSLKYSLPLSFFLYTIFIFCPTSYVFLLENISTTHFFAPCWREDNLPLYVDTPHQRNPQVFGWKVNPPLNQKSNMQLNVQTVTWSKRVGLQTRGSNKLRLLEMSLLTTIGRSGTLGSLFHSMALMIPLRLPIIVQNRPSPALLPSSASNPTQNVVVQVHQEPEVFNNEEKEQFTKCNTETLI